MSPEATRVGVDCGVPAVATDARRGAGSVTRVGSSWRECHRGRFKYARTVWGSGAYAQAHGCGFFLFRHRSDVLGGTMMARESR